MQTLTSRGVGDAAAGLGLHFLHMSEGPFSHDAGQLLTTDDARQTEMGNRHSTIPKNYQGTMCQVSSKRCPTLRNVRKMV